MQTTAPKEECRKGYCGTKKTAESLTAPESIFKEQSGGNIDSWIMGARRDAAELKKQQNP